MSKLFTRTGLIPYLKPDMHHASADYREARDAYQAAARAEVDGIEAALRARGERVTLAAILRILHERGARAPNGGPLHRAHIKLFRERGRPHLATTKDVPQMRLEWRTFPKSGGGFERRQVRVAVGNSKRYTTRKEL